mgnify:FL=1
MMSSSNGSFIFNASRESRRLYSWITIIWFSLDFRARLFASALINRHAAGPSHSPFFLIFFLSQPPSLLELRRHRNSHRRRQAWPLHHPESVQRTRRLFVAGLHLVSFLLSHAPRSVLGLRVLQCSSPVRHGSSCRSSPQLLLIQRRDITRAVVVWHSFLISVDPFCLYRCFFTVDELICTSF